MVLAALPDPAWEAYRLPVKKGDILLLPFYIFKNLLKTILNYQLNSLPRGL